MKELYSDFLISQTEKACATDLAKLLDNKISHDQVTQFLNKKEYTSKDLWQYVKPKLSKIKNKSSGILIFDDTISEKPYTKENEINSWHYDHSKGRSQKGIGILTCFYSSEKVKLPINYEIIKKDELYKDKKTGKEKRKSSITKNEHLRNMLESISKTNVKYEYILADSWYGSKANMNYIHSEMGKKFVLGIKSNRLFSMYSEDSSHWSNYSQLKHSNLKADRSYLIKLKGVNFPMTLIKKVFKNGDGSVGTLYLVSNDLTLNSSELYELYQKRWSIEVYHKNLKNYASLSKSPTKTVKNTNKSYIYELISIL